MPSPLAFTPFSLAVGGAYAVLLISVALLIRALPLVLELLVLSLAAALPTRRHFARLPASFRLAVIVPAHNEETLIANCVGSLRAGASGLPAGIATTIYVVAHNCNDQTAARAETAGAQVLVLHDDIGGKGVALDHGFRHALSTGTDAVLVIDADSVVSPTLLPATIARFAAGADALQCRYEVGNPEASIRTRLAALAFLGMNVLRPLGRSRLGLSCGLFGNGFGLSAATITRVPYAANSLVEDLEYHLNLIHAGIRVDFVDEAHVLGEMPTVTAAAATQRARWEGGRILMRRRWTRPLLAQAFGGHFRMLEPLLELLSPPLATAATLLLAALLLASAALALTHYFILIWPMAFASVGLLIFVFYVLVAASLAPEPMRTLQSLAAAPAYLAWKLVMIPRTRRAAQASAPWVRTARNADDAAPPPQSQP